jgi:post-segregation antitoxin (ccd killing protein)
MMNVQVTVDLPESLVEEARAAGLLNSERIAILLEQELKREAAWEQFSASAAEIRASAEELNGLSDDEIMKLVDEEIDQMRAETRRPSGSPNPQQT